ncbi:MAG TPA: hypothetical protein VM733_13255, partial [Thermoanaerobaculia bacterium]|nr:hypothetical protein [Thermoanaerobaculia bacterium]
MHVALLLLTLLSPYTGRYEQSDGNVVVVWQQGDALIVKPLFWRATQELVPDGEDRFYSRERPERKAVFARDANGRVISLTMNGIGHDGAMMRITHQRIVPAELLMRGKPGDAARAVLRRKDAANVAATWGEFIARALPSKWNDAATFVHTIAAKFPDDKKLRTVEGALLLAAGRRDEAKKAFLAAGDATSLRMLDPDPSLDALFAKPTREEIELVWQRWASRDLSPKEVEIVHRGILGDAEVRIVAHRVHGSRHYGAVIVPRGASKVPVIVEAKGVSPSYFALDLSRSPI